MNRIAVFILVNDLGEILLQKRTADYQYSKQWTLFGGGVKECECPEDACEREMIEELEYNTDMKFIKEIVSDDEEYYIFKGTLNDLSKLVLKEGNGFAFFGLDEIKKLDCPNIDMISEIWEELNDN